MKSKGVPAQSKPLKPETIENKEQLLSSRLVKDNSHFTPDQIVEIYELFKCFEDKTTHLLNVSKFFASLEVYGYKFEENPIIRIIRLMKDDSPENLSFEQFLNKLCEKIGYPSTAQGREAIFNLIDSNDKKYITKKDIEKIAKNVGLNMSDEDLDEILVTFKKENEDDGITLQEFENYFFSRLSLITTTKRRVTEIKKTSK